MGEITIRPISELDIESVSGIDEKITGKYQPEQWEERFLYYLRHDPEVSLVAEQDGRVVGFMLGEVRAGEFGIDEPSGWIESLGVDPDCQGHEIGRQLLGRLLENFRTRGAQAARTLVNTDSQAPLMRFFESAEFTATPIRTLEYAL